MQGAVLHRINGIMYHVLYGIFILCFHVRIGAKPGKSLMNDQNFDSIPDVLQKLRLE